MAAMIISLVTSATRKSPLLRPSRSTTMRSATACTSAMLWLIRIDAEPALAQPLDEVEHLGGLRDAERRGRLVEDDDARLADERAGDRDGLALAAGERGDRNPHRRDAGAAARAAATTSAAPSRPRRATPLRVQLATEPEVADDVEVVAQREVLVDGRDAEVAGVGRAWRSWSGVP